MRVGRLPARKARILTLRYLGAGVVTLLFLFPVYWLFMISFKTPDEIYHVPPLWIPGQIQFSNYYVLFKDGDVLAILNSLIVAGVSSGIAIVLGTLCAYSLARFGTGGENLAMWIISQRMIPPIAVVFPIFLIYVYFGLVDGYFGLILLYTAFNLPYVIWMMRGYIVDVPTGARGKRARGRSGSMGSDLESRLSDGPPGTHGDVGLHLRLRLE